jgi:hypothetical protein
VRLSGAVLFLIFSSFAMTAQATIKIAQDCVNALDSGDMELAKSYVDQIEPLKNIADLELREVGAVCLSKFYDESWKYSFIESGFVSDEGKARLKVEQARKELELAVSNAERDVSRVPALIDLVNKVPNKATENLILKDRSITVIEAFVKPLPASNVNGNLSAYRALSALAPENEVYKAKADKYLADREERGLLAVRKLKSRTEEFDGATWYRHQDSPRYQDTRPYVTFYIYEKNEQRQLIFFLNYSASSWLFVDRAEINIDGKTEVIPSGQWLRDNDTEIWEFLSLPAGAAIVELGERIAASDRAAIRFYGDQFYDDYVVTDADKRAIEDVLLAWEEMQK